MLVRVLVAGVEYLAQPGQPVTFGRSRDCTVCLDPDDTSISRTTADLDFRDGTWWLTNRSASHPLSVVDELGLRSVLAPGRRTAIGAPTRVLVDGAAGRQHSIEIAVPAVAPDESPAPDEPPDIPTGVPTATGAEVLISPADRLAMVALFAGYLRDPPHYDPYPKSYAAAAARLGWPRTTLVKRIEYLRARLDSAGVPNMTGFNALANLAEYAIGRRLVTREDLTLLQG